MSGSRERCSRPTPRWAAVLLCVGLGGPAQAQNPAPTEVLVDRMVAVIGDRLVTQRDLDIEALLADRDLSPVAVLQARRSTPLEYLVDLAVLRDLAGTTSVYRPGSTEVLDRVAGVRDSFDDPEAYFAALEAMELTEQDLASRMLTRMVVERYVTRNLVVRSAVRGDEGEDDPVARYLAWIAELRTGVDIRIVEGPVGR